MTNILKIPIDLSKPDTLFSIRQNFSENIKVKFTANQPGHSANNRNAIELDFWAEKGRKVNWFELSLSLKFRWRNYPLGTANCCLEVSAIRV